MRSGGFIFVLAALVCSPGRITASPGGARIYGPPAPEIPRAAVAHLWNFPFPGLFAAEVERLLVDAPLFLRFERLLRELNHLSFELRQEAFREATRMQYRRTLNDVISAREELAGWLREQRAADEEIAKLEHLVASEVDTGPVAQGEGSDPSPDKSGNDAVSEPASDSLQPGVSDGPLRVGRGPKGGGLDVSLPGRSDVGLRPRELPAIGRARALAENPPRFRGDPKETLTKFSILSKSLPGRPRESTVRSRNSAGGSYLARSVSPAYSDSTSPRNPAEGLVSATDDLRREAAIVEGGTTFTDEAGDFAETEQDADLGGLGLNRAVHLLKGLGRGHGLSGRGSWTFIALAVAMLLLLPRLFRRAVLASLRAYETGSMRLPPPASEERSGMPGARPLKGERTTGAGFSVHWDTRQHCWTLAQRDSRMGMPRLIAELREGSVVYGNLLGRDPFQRFKLNDVDEWLPTDDAERLVLDLREGVLGRRGTG